MKKSFIDWEKRTIIGKSGRVYRISPETLSAGRSAEFEIRSILLPYRINFKTMYENVNEMINTLRSIEIGNLKIGTILDLLNKLESQQKGLLDFHIYKRSPAVEFCGLFCIYDGEDVGTYTEDVIREKYEDWVEIPESDFFLLLGKAIPYFRECLVELNQQNPPTFREELQL
jgi:hypothetical protein